MFCCVASPSVRMGIYQARDGRSEAVGREALGGRGPINISSSESRTLRQVGLASCRARINARISLPTAWRPYGSASLSQARHTLTFGEGGYEYVLGHPDPDLAPNPPSLSAHDKTKS